MGWIFELVFLVVSDDILESIPLEEVEAPVEDSPKDVCSICGFEWHEKPQTPRGKRCDGGSWALEERLSVEEGAIAAADDDKVDLLLPPPLGERRHRRSTSDQPRLARGSCCSRLEVALDGGGGRRVEPVDRGSCKRRRPGVVSLRHKQDP